MTYEELLEIQKEPLKPYQDKYPKLFHYAERVVGRLKSYGRHPAGIVIDPEQSLIDRAADAHRREVPVRSSPSSRWTSWAGSTT